MHQLISIDGAKRQFGTLALEDEIAQNYENRSKHWYTPLLTCAYSLHTRGYVSN